MSEGPPSMNGSNSSASLQKLAALLRECAGYVEQNEFHPDIYQALAQLHAYAGEHADNTTTGSNPRQVSPGGRTSAEHHYTFSSLSKKFQKGLGLAPTSSKPPLNQNAAQATSLKNAERAKADLADLQKEQPPPRKHHHHHEEWCEEHFCMGCKCKELQQKSGASVASLQTTRSIEDAAPPKPKSTKPSFQRPVNPKSILIANGWIEQQRRSKMRDVWKGVLASLVEGRKPGEETTLWIQREVTNIMTGKPELEALHQIPIKWIVAVEYLDYTTDHQFAMKVHNVEENFLFRCSDAESAQNWVLTLRSVKEVTLKEAAASQKSVSPKNGVDDWETSSNSPQARIEQQPPPEKSHRMTIKELRAIAHGAGVNTSGMERRELELAVSRIAGGAQSDSAKQKEELKRKELEQRKRREEELAEERARWEEEERRMDEEGRRAEAERKQRMEEERQIRMEEERQRRAEEERQRRADEERRRVEEERQRRMEEDALQRRTEEEARQRRMGEEARQRRMEDEARQRRMEEEARQRRLDEEAERKRRIEEEARKRRMEEERRRMEEEQRRRAEQQAAEQRRFAEQQAAEQRRRQEEAQRIRAEQEAAQKRVAEQQAAELRRRQEEAKRQQWQQQQQQQQQQQWQYRQQQQSWQQRQQPQPPPQQQHWQQQQQQRPNQQPPFPGQAPGRAASPSGHPQPPPQQYPTSPINQKYAKMAAQDDDGGQAAISAIKHNILVKWALQPPQYQSLRPIAVLLTTIHSVFPPAFGVKGHEYFAKWKAVSRDDLDGPGRVPEEEKLKKSVRKLRFFLHPDKLPRDLNDEQQFMCKMLWDITSDAWEEFEKHKEELDWIRG